MISDKESGIMPPQRKARYGVDAPGAIRNQLLIGMTLCLLILLFPIVKIGSVSIDIRGLIWAGLGCMLGGLLMLFYSLYGKFKHRDRMLNLISWRGDEQVLDVGTGKGLLLIGAAKKLSTGFATGIDIWNAEDLSGNTMESTIKNAGYEGVQNKVEVKNENVMQMSFADQTFDVILSNMCIHNIYSRKGRKTACQEIARVLKTGGTALIADFRHIKEYQRNFEELGLSTRYLYANYFTTFPAVAMVVVTK